MIPKHGVVSLLDRSATEKVRRTWDRLEREFGLRGVRVMPFPHFTYQIAEGYDRPGVEETLAELARATPPFEISTQGLATFGGDLPVIFVAVEADPSLRALHERLWTSVTPRARGPVAYYSPGSWVPHITLAHGEERNTIPLPAVSVERVLAALDPAEFRWEVTIDNYALVWDEATIQRPVATFPLGRR